MKEKKKKRTPNYKLRRAIAKGLFCILVNVSIAAVSVYIILHWSRFITVY